MNGIIYKRAFRGYDPQEVQRWMEEEYAKQKSEKKKIEEELYLLVAENERLNEEVNQLTAELTKNASTYEQIAQLLVENHFSYAKDLSRLHAELDELLDIHEALLAEQNKSKEQLVQKITEVTHFLESLFNDEEIREAEYDKQAIAN